MIFVVDNYDSFTYNLVQMLSEAGIEVDVRRNDALTAEELVALQPRAVVLSPGPGRPEDAGLCLDLIDGRPKLPILGVCLGHQVLGQSFGAVVDRAPELLHGKTSAVRHRGDALFEEVPSPFEATRYHSLTVLEETLPEELEATAWADDGTLMAMRHRVLPYWGVQFHPESILTVAGALVVRNFLALAEEASP